MKEQEIRYGGIRLTLKLGLHALKRIMHYEDYCAQNGRPAYLETHSEKNVGIYRHFGFEVVSDGTIPGTDVTHWGMVK